MAVSTCPACYHISKAWNKESVDEAMACECPRGCHDAVRFGQGVPLPVPPWPLSR